MKIIQYASIALLTACGSSTGADSAIHDLTGSVDTDDPTTTSCFVAGTRVLTDRGWTAIETIEAGDKVWSWDTDTNEPALRTVACRIEGQNTRTIRVAAGELVIEGVTGEHPFYCPDRSEWIKADELSTSSQVLCWLGEHEAQTKTIAPPIVTTHDDAVPVYTLSVDGPEHNFFAEGILVHNKSPLVTQIDAVGIECVKGRFVLSIDTIAWTSSGRFNLWETGNMGGWDEEHPIMSVDFHPKQWWDNLEASLEPGVDPSAFQPGINTVFQCGVHDVDPVMTWMARVTDTTGADADCWIGSTDPKGVDTIMGGGGPAYNSVSNPEDIAGCTVYTR